ncbi:MAG: HAD family phosphatase [Clostridia bacterium]|nr:HAD family phosphatase [Clostridia bacterium]
MIKALFFDLDGTLLSSSKTILPSAREALTACRAQGVQVYFATARSARLDRMLGWTDAEYALFDGGSFCNGACMQMRGETCYAFIDPTAVQDVLAAVKEHPGVHLSLHMPQEVHAFNYRLPDAALAPWGLTREEIAVIDDNAVQSATKLLVFHDDLVNTDRLLPPGLFAMLQERCGSRANIYLTDQGRTIQVVPLTAGKVAAIERMRQSLGLETDEIAVFGDDINDLEMLTRYPHSVAMGNGAQAVRTAAAYVTHGNDDDGIAYALRQLLRII